MKMKRFCVQIEFSENTVLGSIPRSTTIFGGLCWAIREFENEAKLEEFLNLVEKENALILSDLHPQGHHLIPFNILKPSEQNNGQTNGKKQTKKWKKAKYCEQEINMIEQELIDQWIEKDKLKTESDFFKRQHLTRNAIERDESQTTQATPYPFEVFHPKHPEKNNSEKNNSKEAKFQIIVDSPCFEKSEIEQYFSYLKVTGLGRKTSIGLGVVKNIEVQELNFDFEKQTKSVMALASFIPKTGDPYKGYYQLTTAPSRGLDGQIYPKITRVQARSVFTPDQGKITTHLGKCPERVKSNRLIYGLSPIQHIDMDIVYEEDAA